MFLSQAEPASPEAMVDREPALVQVLLLMEWSPRLAQVAVVAAAERLRLLEMDELVADVTTTAASRLAVLAE
jgi:hypothetical protein